MVGGYIIEIQQRPSNATIREQNISIMIKYYEY